MTDLQDRILSAMVTDNEKIEPFTAPEVAKILDESPRTVRYNLTRLADEGRINRKDNTDRVTTYWL